MTTIDNFSQRMEQLLNAVHEQYGGTFDARKEASDDAPDPSDPMVYAQYYATLIDHDWYYLRFYERVVTYIPTLSVIEDQFDDLDPEEHRLLELFIGAFHAMGSSLERLDYPEDLVFICYEKALVMARRFYGKQAELGWKLLLSALKYLSGWHRHYGDSNVTANLMSEMLDLYDRHYTDPEMVWLTREYTELHADLKKLLIALDDKPALQTLLERSHPLISL